MTDPLRTMTVTVTVEVDGTTITRHTTCLVGTASRLPIPDVANAEVSAMGDLVHDALAGIYPA